MANARTLARLRMQPTTMQVKAKTGMIDAVNIDHPDCNQHFERYPDNMGPLAGLIKPQAVCWMSKRGELMAAWYLPMRSRGKTYPRKVA